MSSDTVKPTPASIASPSTSHHERSASNSARVKRATSHAQDTDRLADDQPHEDANCDRIAKCLAQPAGAADRNPGGEEREHRYGN